MSRYALHGEETRLVGLSGVEGMSANEELVNTFAVGIFDFEVNIKTQAAFGVTTKLAVGVAGVGAFEVVFHHLPEFFTGDVTDGDGGVVGDDVVEIARSNVTRRNGSSKAPAIGEGQFCATSFLAGMKE